MGRNACGIWCNNLKSQESEYLYYNWIEHDYLAILEFSGCHTSQKFEEESAIFKQIHEQND
jgi:hypothetical protein